MTALVIAAHPDDEVLGCGGTIARLRSEGTDVVVHILAQGVTARPDWSQTQIDQLRLASTKAMAELAVDSVNHHDMPDNRMDTVPVLEVARLIESIVADVKPSAIYTHHTGDLNIDHRATALGVLTATRPTPNNTVVDVYSWETASSTEWAFYRAGPTFEPNVFVEITDYLPAKLSAMSAYASEMRKFPHPRSLEGLRSMAAFRGASVGVDAAEAFELVRSVRRQKP